MNARPRDGVAEPAKMMKVSNAIHIQEWVKKPELGPAMKWYLGCVSEPPEVREHITHATLV